MAGLVPVLFWRDGFGLGSLLPLLLIPLGGRLHRRLRSGPTPGELIALLGDTAKLVAAYAVLFAIGINL